VQSELTASSFGLFRQEQGRVDGRPGMNECPALMTTQTAPSLRGQEPIDGSYTGNPLIDIVWSTNPAKRRPDKRASDKDCVMWVGERQVPRTHRHRVPERLFGLLSLQVRRLRWPPLSRTGGVP